METSVTKRIAKNFTWLSIGDIISRGLIFFAIIYIARVLGAAAFGLLNFAQAFLAYLVLLVDSGLSLFGAREIAKAKEKVAAISLNIFAIRFLIALIIFLISLFILFLLPLSFEIRLLFIGTFLFIFYRALSADWVFQGLEIMQYIAYSRIFYSILAFILVVCLIKSSADLVKVPFVLFASGMIASVLFLSILYKRITTTSLSHLAPLNWWEYFSEAIPLGASMILVQIYYNMDTIMLGFMDTPEVVGYYNAAYKIFLVFIGFLTIWQSTAFPVMSKRVIKEKDKVQNFLDKYIRLTMLVAIPISIIVTILSPLIISLFFGSNYISSYQGLQILIWSIIFISITSVYGVLILVPLGKSREFLYGVASGALINIILNIILIPPYSFKGAALATLLSEVTVAMVMFYFARKEIYVKVIENLKIPIWASSVAIFFSIIGQYFSPANFKLISGSIIFSAIYFLMIIILGEKRFLLDFYKEIIKR
ncbi:hypothetical protein AMJ44_02360 [candidate division WOR-1 bacterium DG_54_3]|uniref:Uncharacterized protein n=1 Tax=candidate division WOR-1 bacterium DG_54_3 TaxID=1703775 RepID=A0A0S7Y6M1_UNCSA|nr:MAG: hypothetical protein AMJ44_02360 [candidate division WOR-1 bacterium DG_54_3]